MQTELTHRLLFYMKGNRTLKIEGNWDKDGDMPVVWLNQETQTRGNLIWYTNERN